MGAESLVYRCSPDSARRARGRAIVAIAAATALLLTSSATARSIESVESASLVVHEQQLVADHAQENAFLGVGIAVDGHTLAAGAPGASTGEVFVYRRALNGAWLLEASLTASDGQEHDAFGARLDIAGRELVVAAPSDDDAGAASGSVYVFRRQPDGSWIETQKLLPPDPGIGVVFGSGVGVDGDLMVVGAPGVDDIGAAYIYRRAANGHWRVQTRLTPSDGALFDDFGWDADISGQTVVIGANNARDGLGAAYVYTVFGAEWKEQTVLRPNPGGERGSFGDDVAIDDRTIVVGEPSGEGVERLTGVAHVFTQDAAGTWLPDSELVDPDGAGDDGFGLAVHVEGDLALVGAYRDDDSGVDSGSGFVFRMFPDGEWRLIATLGATWGAAGDWFGVSAAVDGSTVVFGASRVDTEAVDAGSVSVFELRRLWRPR